MPTGAKGIVPILISILVGVVVAAYLYGPIYNVVYTPTWNSAAVPVADLTIMKLSTFFIAVCVGVLPAAAIYAVVK
jgi:hypothetical protein